MPYQIPEPIATFEDQFGDTRTVRKGRHGLQLQQQGDSPVNKLSLAIAKIIGAKIREHRKAKGLSLEQLGRKIGIEYQPAKARMFAIETSPRHGVRMGTLYAIANVLEIEVTALLPTMEEAMKAANVTRSTMETLK